MDYTFKRRRLNEIPESKIIEELEKAAKHFNYIEFSWRSFDSVADISRITVMKHYGTWLKALEALRIHLQAKGLDLKPRPHAPNRIYSDKQLFDEMERIWKLAGQRPSRNEWYMNSPKISHHTYQSRFGSWTNACTKFIEYKMGAEILSDDFVLPEKTINKETENLPTEHTPENYRNVSLSIRLDVLNRDNFRCVFCGKSPATDIGTKLHIDHILAFSKGGKSVLENLQTLCEDCNLGKSDRDIKLSI